jgi:hypothetical protein
MRSLGMILLDELETPWQIEGDAITILPGR